MDSFQVFKPDIEIQNNIHKLHAFGIDLGTTNSSVAVASWTTGDKPICRVLEIDQPLWPAGTMTSPLLPSVVAVLDNEKPMVGEGAKRLRTRPQEANLFPERNLFYETKNDMGLRKSYHRAPESFNHASKIAGHILRFLKEAALQDIKDDPVHFCVTVPASFQLNQRRDTLLACGYAGIDLQDDDLLDEPTAALIDYIMTQSPDRIAEAGRTTQCVVFDFGGGTCDVSVLEITADKKTKQLLMSQVAVSRYHRLGGGDLDAAIVHEHLIPELLKENGLSPLDLTWAEKKRGLEPQLLGTAEALKEALCREIDRLKKFSKYDEADKEEVMARQPGITLQLGKRSFHLSRPKLTAAQWENILKPFLDKDLLFARETEFRLTQSIVAPLQDALDRANIKPEEIDFCLMAGGSSLIPLVREAVESYFDKSAVGFFQDSLAIQLSVARAAAWNSLYKAVTGQNMIRPVLHDALALVTIGEALYPLVPAQTILPYPADGKWARVELIISPQEGLFVDKLLFKVVGMKDRQTILHEVWYIPEKIAAGTEIVMEYKITAGKQFQCRAFLKEAPELIFEHAVENPLVNVINPGGTRLLIEEKEEELKKRGSGSADDRDDFIQLARWYAELNQNERALDWLRAASSKLGRPDAEILNLQGIYYAALGDHERSDKLYREADRATPSWGGPLFNLALSYRRRTMYKEALETIEGAIKKEGQTGPSMTFRAMCLESIEPDKEHKDLYVQAIKVFSRPALLTDWEFG
ncbi:MAG: Hsp70 family protein [Deltaproteobacteria bacterium]|nr:Hsp70 family protein [Deltaproteobacteria bacterium]